MVTLFYSAMILLDGAAGPIICNSKASSWIGPRFYKADRWAPYYRASHDFSPPIFGDAGFHSRQLILFSLDNPKRQLR